MHGWQAQEVGWGLEVRASQSKPATATLYSQEYFNA
jgi:hypothetical protein